MKRKKFNLKPSLVTVFFVRHNNKKAFALGLWKIKYMNVWHKRFMYLQILLLGFLLFINLYDNLISYVGLCVFILLEFGVLHNQNKENPDAVIYRKSCLFAFADLFSVFVFLFYFVAIFISISYRVQFEFILHTYKYLPILFLYILIRKFYIIKNYSYEK